MAACSGAILSMILVTIVVGYSAQKFNVVAAQSSAFITTAKHEHYYPADHTFGAEQGLNMAVAVIGLGAAFLENGSLDPSYAEMKANVFEWDSTSREGFDALGTNTEIKTHSCSREELGLEGPNSLFMKI